MLDLSPPEFLFDREQTKNSKIDKLRYEWILKHKADPDLDHDIIFKHDDEIQDHPKMKFSFQTPAYESAKGTNHNNKTKGGAAF